MISIVSLREF